jgi:hypothetical protein
MVDLDTMVDLGDLFECHSAILEAAKGKPERLAAFLRLSKPISDGDKELLAEFVEGNFKTPRGRRPRPLWMDPKRDAVDRAAHFVWRVKKQLHERGKGYGTHEDAVRIAFAQLKSGGFRVPTRTSLDNYMRRQRNPYINPP